MAPVGQVDGVDEVVVGQVERSRSQHPAANHGVRRLVLALNVVIMKTQHSRAMRHPMFATLTQNREPGRADIMVSFLRVRVATVRVHFMSDNFEDFLAKRAADATSKEAMIKPRVRASGNAVSRVILEYKKFADALILQRRPEAQFSHIKLSAYNRKGLFGTEVNVSKETLRTTEGWILGRDLALDTEGTVWVQCSFSLGVKGGMGPNPPKTKFKLRVTDYVRRDVSWVPVDIKSLSQGYENALLNSKDKVVFSPSVPFVHDDIYLTAYPKAHIEWSCRETSEYHRVVPLSGGNLELIPHDWLWIEDYEDTRLLRTFLFKLAAPRA